MSELPDLLYGFYRTDLIVCGHNGDKDRLVRYRVAQPLHVCQTIPVHGKISHLPTLFLKKLARIQNRLVLSDAGYYMISLVTVRLRDSFDSQIVGLRRAAGKNNLPR